MCSKEFLPHCKSRSSVSLTVVMTSSITHTCISMVYNGSKRPYHEGFLALVPRPGLMAGGFTWREQAGVFLASSSRSGVLRYSCCGVRVGFSCCCVLMPSILDVAGAIVAMTFSDPNAILLGLFGVPWCRPRRRQSRRPCVRPHGKKLISQ